MGGTHREPLPSVSVVICAFTDERWDDTLAAVASVRAQRPEPHEVIVVVDHNPALRDRFAAALDVTVVENSGVVRPVRRQEHGVALAQGDVVAFLDDDAVAQPGWLKALARPFADPDVLGVGGLTLPAWATERPRWLPEEFDWVVGCTFIGAGTRGRSGTCSAATPPSGARSSTSRAGSRSHIGRSSAGKRPLGCEETEFCIRVSQLWPGGKFVFDPRAVIRHRVPPARATLRLLPGTLLRGGAVQGARHRERRSSGRTCPRSGRYAADTLRRGVGRGLREGLSGDVRGLAPRRGDHGRARLHHGRVISSAGRVGAWSPRGRLVPMIDRVPSSCTTPLPRTRLPRRARLSVRPTDFEWQLRHLREHGFTGLTFGDLCERSRTGAAFPAERPVVLTFDDGYADFHEQALPLLAEYGFPATLFVTTGWLRDAGRWAAGRPLDKTLVWAQVQELHDSGVEIAAHSHSHAQLDQLGRGSLRSELAISKTLLEDRLRSTVTSFAYPYGYSSPRVREAVKEAGYEQAAAVANAATRPDSNRFAVPRLTVRRSTTPGVFTRVVNCEGLQWIFGLDRVMTSGWSLVRRTRCALGGARRE